MDTCTIYWRGHWYWWRLKGGDLSADVVQSYILENLTCWEFLHSGEVAKSTSHRGRRRDAQVGDNPEGEQSRSETAEADREEARE